MEKADSSAKTMRLLALCDWFKDGRTIKKSEAAQYFNVTEKSIQRDLDELRCFFAEQEPPSEVVYDTKSHGYYLVSKERRFLNNSEILAVCKILLESRSMRQDEMLPILDRLLDRCVSSDSRKSIKELILNEKHHYIPPHHNRPLLDFLWEIGQAVQHHQVLEIEYERLKEPRLVKRVVEPVGIMFSEYYFYLTAFLQNVDREADFENKDDIFPTIYRIDRIRSLKQTGAQFHVPYRDRFEEGEFRKRIQFMYGGRLQTVKFKYTGLSIEAVLDRLPTARILDQDAEGWIVQAEVFGNGIDMWIKSQGEHIQPIKEAGHET